MTTQHTPGPWTVVDHSWQEVSVYDAEGCIVCALRLDEDDCDDLTVDALEATMNANAHLIAAVPDLLTAAQTVLADLHARIDAAGAGPVPVFRGIADLHSAIAKATQASA